MNRDVIVVVGETGYGKSLWGKLRVRSESRLLLYDPAVSYQNVVWCEDGQRVLDTIAKSGIERDVYPTFRIGVVDPLDVPTIGHTAFVVGKVMIVLEEAASLFRVGMAALPDWLHRLVFFGRHRSVSIMVLAQRAASIPIQLRSQATRLIAFQQHERDDLAWLSGKLSHETVKQLPSLPRWTCIDVRDNIKQQYSIVREAEEMEGVQFDRNREPVLESLSS